MSVLNAIYSEHLFNLAKNKKNEKFFNSSSDHAIVVHQALAKYAERYIDIYSRSLCSEISNNPDYCKYIQQFLESSPENKIKIILTNYNADEFKEKPIAKILASFPNQVQLKSYKGEIQYEGKPVNFTVTADRAFRLETDIENYKAFGNFNSPEQAAILRENFDKLFNSDVLTQPIQLVA
jgi:hypothetical protein